MLLALCMAVLQCSQLGVLILSAITWTSLPPTLVWAHVQLSMPVMYAPMYLLCSAQQTQSWADSYSLPFLLVLVKGNIQMYRLWKEESILFTICASCTRNSLYLRIPVLECTNKSQKRRNVYYHARKACVLQKCNQPKMVVQPDITVKLSSVHMHHDLD